MVTPHTELIVGDGPFTVVLWCNGRPIILVGLERYTEQGDQFEIEGVVWFVVEDGESYVAERLAG